MASASMADIKSLRQRTGAGILDCKKALTESDSVEAAIDWLRTKGIAKAAKKASRAATEGLVYSYIHGTGRIGVLVEINCETDFAAMNDQFKSFVHDIAMHIAAAAPEYVSIDDVPDEIVAKEKAVQIARTMDEGKPEHIAERIVVGRLDKWKKGLCLNEQPFVKDDSKTIGDFTKDTIAVIGENIQIRRFSRYVLGEGLVKKEDDFAAEVAKMSGN
ncbi:MAG: elongation factor Ts [Myxococcota bacterium]|jgi:elongation factor Ts